MRKVIKDPIHGYIEVDDLAIEIIDTVEMQRLRRIKQLGFSYLVYPGANHTRFEHSLGTYHLMKTFLEKLGSDVVKEEEKEEELLVAALIHDVGHGPYSHVTEPLLKKFGGKSHEDIEEIVLGDENKKESKLTLLGEEEGGGKEKTEAVKIVEVLEKHRLDKKKIMKYIKGEKERTEKGKRDFSKILNGEIDIDKMDYLVRDSYYTGVAYGVVDNVRLLEGLDFFEENLVITEKGILPAEYFLFSRFLMYPTVYFHHTVRIAQLMFSRAVEHFIESSSSYSYSQNEYASLLKKMDDAEMRVAMQGAKGYTREIMGRINNRKLFKRAVYKRAKDLNEGIIEELSEERNIKEIEEEISRKAGAGIDAKYVLLDVQSNNALEEGEAKVFVDNTLKSLRETSTFVRMLNIAFQEINKIGVYTLEKHRREVKKAAEDSLC